MSETENRNYESRPSVRATGSVQREKVEPKTGLEPLTLGLFATCALVLVLGGGYVGAKSGGFDFNQTTIDNYKINTPEEIGAVVKKESPLEQYLIAGKNAYIACQACHQANGQGLGQIPPLVGSEWVTEGTERFAQIILNGLVGPISVGGNSYGAQVMLPQKDMLNDQKIAQVMTYVRHEFGGASDMIVTKEMVVEARKRHGDMAGSYNSADLAPADSMLPGEQPDWMIP